MVDTEVWRSARPRRTARKGWLSRDGDSRLHHRGIGLWGHRQSAPERPSGRRMDHQPDHRSCRRHRRRLDRQHAVQHHPGQLLRTAYLVAGPDGLDHRPVRVHRPHRTQVRRAGLTPRTPRRRGRPPIVAAAALLCLCGCVAAIRPRYFRRDSTPPRPPAAAASCLRPASSRRCSRRWPRRPRRDAGHRRRHDCRR